MKSPTGKRVVLLAALMILGGVGRLSAQVYTGRIDVSVEDSAGKKLAGVSVSVTGPMEATQVSDVSGHAHFLNLPIGLFTVKGTMPGLTPFSRARVEVIAGAATIVRVHLAAAAAGSAEGERATSATVTTDPGRAAVTTHAGLEELQSIPSAHDPWAVLQTVPTVYADRVNVGSAASGDQSTYTAKGALPSDNTWNLEGVPVTDMGAAGTSALFYNFDGLQDLAVTTGGADVRSATAGVQVNVIPRSGWPSPHATVRYYLESPQLESPNVPSDLAASLFDPSSKLNFTDHYQDYGVDLGGPFLKDRIWIWGTFAKTDLRLLTLAGLPDETSFTNDALRADGILTDKIRGHATFVENEKAETGYGVGVIRPAETSLDRSGPARFAKGEADFILGPRLFATARGARIGDAVVLAPAGGLTANYYLDDSGVYHGTFSQHQTDRLQLYAAGEASYVAGAHHVTFGGSWRSTPVTTQQTYPGNHMLTVWAGYPTMFVQVARDYAAATDAKYVSGFISDTISLDRLTITGGIRFDRQTSSLAPASVPAVAGFESVLPALSAPAVNDVYRWSNLTPRVGIAYAIGAARRTVARASYAAFASQLPGSQAAFVSPIQHSYAYYNAVDVNKDGLVQPTEVLVNRGLRGYSGFDPANPTRLSSVNAVDPNVTAPTTHEVLVGMDQELGPSLSVSGTITYRRMLDLLWEPLIGVSQSSYTQTGTLTGNIAEVGAYSVPLYALRASTAPAGGGQRSTNRAGYHQRYLGVEISATKRLSQRWTGRFGFSTNSWREYFDDPSLSITDPTKTPTNPQVDGGLVVQQGTGTGQSTIYMVSPGYQFFGNGVFQGPWDVNVSASLSTRQGYAEPFFMSNVSTGDPLGRKTVLLVQNVDAFRLPAVTTLDGRIEKQFTFSGLRLAVDFDVFNLLNSATVLGRQYDARLTGATGFDQVLEIVNPRIARVGVRLFF
jgi:hypothetical protein